MKKPSKSKHYFTQQTENAIIRYNSSEDAEERAQIFQEDIYYPFYKLVENIIHTFKFYYTDVVDVEDLKHNIITILLEEKIHKFDPKVGAKAYSYFGTIVKRWLINYNNSNYKELKRLVDFDSLDVEFIEDDIYIEEDSISLSDFFDLYVSTMYEQLSSLFQKEKDIQIADAVLTLFKSRKDIQVFKKKALYIYIREMVDCKTADLTEVVKVLKYHFYKLYKAKNERGLLNNL